MKIGHIPEFLTIKSALAIVCVRVFFSPSVFTSSHWLADQDLGIMKLTSLKNALLSLASYSNSDVRLNRSWWERRTGGEKRLAKKERNKSEEQAKKKKSRSQ